METATKQYAITDTPNVGSVTKPLLSKDLFGARRDLCIQHNEKLYTLRITANNKLILVA